MKIARSLALFMLLNLAAIPSLHAENGLFQYSTIQALMEGIYDGDLTFKGLSKHGDFGIGTFNALDGEMIGVDGKFYQVKADGVAYPVAETAKTPFANVTFFRAEKTINIKKAVGFNELEKCLGALLPSANLIYAIKITGTFPYIKTRSVPRQQKPYPRLTDAVKQQAVFEFREIKGVLVGFRTPPFLSGVNVAGYHLHFITADRRAGGHVLDFRTGEAEIETSRMTKFDLHLPQNAEFLRKDLTAGGEKAVDRVEK
ncbi:MAG: acetolactate decarboxylase [Deltaproteobacteria bacterium]|nr:acetolactate decarboxylase [Deltaproteobacteria bacterium]